MSNPRIILHPADTAKIFLEHGGSKEHLWYRVHYDQQASEKEKNDKSNARKSEAELKYMFRKNISTIDSLDKLSAIGKKVYESRISALQDLDESYVIKIFKMNADSLFIHGIGASHVRENSLTIHPVYGIPYIPGSSVKGIVRRWYIDALLEGKEARIKEDAFESAIGRSMFGTGDAQGIVQFYDILMYEGLKLRTDIVTPHFMKYYSKESEPVDSLEPVPNKFYAVQIISANLLVTVDKNKLAQLSSEVALTEDQFISLTTKWVQAALQELGVGGKTSSGYGRFSYIEDVSESSLEVFRKEKEEQLRQLELRKREERLASMSPAEKLLYEIEHLTASESDIQRSKTVIFEAVIKEKQVEAAKKLKQYWINNIQWKISTKQKQNKQEEKCASIEELSASDTTSKH